MAHVLHVLPPDLLGLNDEAGLSEVQATARQLEHVVQDPPRAKPRRRSAAPKRVANGAVVFLCFDSDDDEVITLVQRIRGASD